MPAVSHSVTAQWFDSMLAMFRAGFPFPIGCVFELQGKWTGQGKSDCLPSLFFLRCRQMDSYLMASGRTEAARAVRIWPRSSKLAAVAALKPALQAPEQLAEAPGTVSQPLMGPEARAPARLLAGWLCQLAGIY